MSACPAFYRLQLACSETSLYSGGLLPTLFLGSQVLVGRVAQLPCISVADSGGWPDRTEMPPGPGDLVPTPSPGSPVPVDTVARPRCTCLDLDKYWPDCSE